MGAKLNKEQTTVLMKDMKVGQVAVILEEEHKLHTNELGGAIIQRCLGNIAIIIGTDDQFNTCHNNTLPVRVLEPGTTIVLT